MNNEWEAVTKSGTKYRYQGGRIRIIPVDGRPHTISPIALRASVSNEAELMVPWIRPEQWMDVTRPVIGRRLYVCGTEEWRISTAIVSVEDM